MSVKTPQFMLTIPQFARTLGKRPGPLRTGHAVLTASGSGKPQRAVQVREDAGSWLSALVARRWQ
jgi:hypothetical protein